VARPVVGLSVAAGAGGGRVGDSFRSHPAARRLLTVARARALRGGLSRYTITAIPNIARIRFESTAGRQLTRPSFDDVRPGWATAHAKATALILLAFLVVTGVPAGRR
jgi:hypothetical protein